MKLPVSESQGEGINGSNNVQGLGAQQNIVVSPEAGSPSVGQNNGGGAPEPDFSEFLWMEHEEEYDEQVLRELEDEETINYYFELYEASLEAEANGDPQSSAMRVPAPPAHTNSTHDSRVDELTRGFNRSMNFSSPLNPNAAEFVPGQVGGSNMSKPL